jgi:hypothetical protein
MGGSAICQQSNQGAVKILARLAVTNTGLLSKSARQNEVPSMDILKCPLTASFLTFCWSELSILR